MRGSTRTCVVSSRTSHMTHEALGFRPIFLLQRLHSCRYLDAYHSMNMKHYLRVCTTLTCKENEKVPAGAKQESCIDSAENVGRFFEI